MELIIVVICLCGIVALTALYNLVIANATYLVFHQKEWMRRL